jgi:hypothetical protein
MVKLEIRRLQDENPATFWWYLALPGLMDKTGYF